jgi:hypothetical protein
VKSGIRTCEFGLKESSEIAENESVNE